MNKKITKIFAVGLTVILVITAFTLVVTSSVYSTPGENSGTTNDVIHPNGGNVFINRTENASANGAATFLKVEGYQPWAALVINAGNPSGVDLVTVSFDNETLTITAQDSNETNNATILINKGFADKYMADSEGNLDMNLSEAVNYEGLDESNETADGASYVFHIEHFSTQTIELSRQDNGDPPFGKDEMHRNRAENASANGSSTFLNVDDYDPWAALVVNAGNQDGVDLVTVEFDNGTFVLNAKDSNETNHVTILINKEFADKYLADSENDLQINASDAVNYEGVDEDNETGEGSMYVFHIEHFSTQTIELSKQNDFEPPVEGGQAFTDKAENAAANGAATFLRVEGYEPWAALVVNAGNPDGVDAVTVSFENDTLTIEAQDSNETNHVTILVNKEFADKYIADSEGDLEINVSDAVNYEGLDESNETAEGASYVFHIEHFSTQTIELTQNPPDFEPPVEGGQGFTDRAENAAANGAVTFLRVEGYEPWAAMVVNAGNPDGVDAVTVSFEDDILTIEAQDSNETNHVTILVNKEFADEYLAESEGDLEINVSDAVNYEGLDESNESAGGGSMYVFHVEHFSTQTIEISKQNDFEPPVEGGQGLTDKAENAAANGATTFLRVEGYEPWAAMVVNAGNPDGVDSVTVNFDDETLTIEAQDSNETNHVTILVNKEFADEHLADSEGDLDIETSDAVNYEGLDESNESAGGGGMYVFHIEHFSTQTIDISAADEIPFVGAPLILIAAAIPVVYYNIKKRKK